MPSQLVEHDDGAGVVKGASDVHDEQPHRLLSFVGRIFGHASPAKGSGWQRWGLGFASDLCDALDSDERCLDGAQGGGGKQEWCPPCGV